MKSRGIGTRSLIVICIFSVLIFVVASLYAYGIKPRVGADGVVLASPTPVTSLPTASPSTVAANDLPTAGATTPSPDSLASSPTPTASAAAAGSTEDRQFPTSPTPVETVSTPIPVASVVAPQPFYADWRYLILLADGLIVIALLFVLTLRLLGKVVEEPSADGDNSSQTEPDPNQPKTIDQLNIDIPM